MSIDAMTREGPALRDHHRVISDAFRASRQSAKALGDYPGTIPHTLSQAYSIQDCAIDNWPDTIIGWKVGRILGALSEQYGSDRLIGPIFSQTIQTADALSPTHFGMIAGGFCAVEAEFVFVLGSDAPTDGRVLSDQEALQLVSALHIGIEIAGSPLATINDLGPCVVISDFGNNAGLIIGAPIAGWESKIEDLTGQMYIDSMCVGNGSVSAFPGGIAKSLSFALNNAAARGRPLKSGMLISTGAVSGVHDIVAGQSAIANFGDHGTISCTCFVQQALGV